MIGNNHHRLECFKNSQNSFNIDVDAPICSIPHIGVKKAFWTVRDYTVHRTAFSNRFQNLN